MANATSASLKLTVQQTGENSGTWGQYTNTNLLILEQAIGGYQSVALNATTGATLTFSNGVISNGKNAALKLTGALTGNVDVIIPNSVEKTYIIDNATTGVFTMTVKTTSGSGVTWGTADKGTKMVYSDGTNVVDTAFTDLSSDYTPQLIADLDVNGQDIVSASNADIDIIPNGSGDVNLGADTVQVGDNNADATITTQGTGDLILNTNNGTNAGNITLADGANGDITITPDGTGVAKAVDGADATGAIKIAGKETIFVPAQAMFGTTTNGADAQAIETTATRPELKVLDFDASTNEYAQFSIAMPKSWNLDTVTFQAFWSPGDTDTGNALIGLQGVGVANDDTSDIAFGAAVDVTDAGGGAVEDVLVSPVSGAITIAGTPADDDYTYFQVYRNAADGSDTFTGDVRLLGIKLFYTTDAANDA